MLCVSAPSGHGPGQFPGQFGRDLNSVWHTGQPLPGVDWISCDGAGSEAASVAGFLRQLLGRLLGATACEALRSALLGRLLKVCASVALPAPCERRDRVRVCLRPCYVFFCCFQLRLTGRCWLRFSSRLLEVVACWALPAAIACGVCDCDCVLRWRLRLRAALRFRLLATSNCVLRQLSRR